MQMHWRCAATYHSYDFRVHGLCEHAPSVRDVHGQIVEGCSLDLLALQIGHRVHEVERDAALPQLPDEQILLLLARTLGCICCFCVGMGGLL